MVPIVNKGEAVQEKPQDKTSSIVANFRFAPNLSLISTILYTRVYPGEVHERRKYLMTVDTGQTCRYLSQETRQNDRNTLFMYKFEKQTKNVFTHKPF